LVSQDATAVAPGDYEKISAQVIQFAANQVEQEITVKIFDDKKQEPRETFKLVLTTKDPRVTTKPDIASVCIVNDDGKYL
jgi:hypothetical protein